MPEKWTLAPDSQQADRQRSERTILFPLNHSCITNCKFWFASGVVTCICQSEKLNKFSSDLFHGTTDWMLPTSTGTVRELHSFLILTSGLVIKRHGLDWPRESMGVCLAVHLLNLNRTSYCCTVYLDYNCTPGMHTLGKLIFSYRSKHSHNNTFGWHFADEVGTVKCCSYLPRFPDPPWENNSVAKFDARFHFISMARLLHCSSYVYDESCNIYRMNKCCLRSNTFIHIYFRREAHVVFTNVNLCYWCCT